MKRKNPVFFWILLKFVRNLTICFILFTFEKENVFKTTTQDCSFIERLHVYYLAASPHNNILMRNLLIFKYIFLFLLFFLFPFYERRWYITQIHWNVSKVIICSWMCKETRHQRKWNGCKLPHSHYMCLAFDRKKLKKTTIFWWHFSLNVSIIYWLSHMALFMHAQYDKQPYFCVLNFSKNESLRVCLCFQLLSQFRLYLSS